MNTPELPLLFSLSDVSGVLDASFAAFLPVAIEMSIVLMAGFILTRTMRAAVKHLSHAMGKVYSFDSMLWYWIDVASTTMVLALCSAWLLHALHVVGIIIVALLLMVFRELVQDFVYGVIFAWGRELRPGIYLHSKAGQGRVQNMGTLGLRVQSSNGDVLWVSYARLYQDGLEMSWEGGAKAQFVFHLYKHPSAVILNRMSELAMASPFRDERRRSFVKIESLDGISGLATYTVEIPVWRQDMAWLAEQQFRTVMDSTMATLVAENQPLKLNCLFKSMSKYK